ncbi:MAG: DUF456 domain-containing protein [Chloroflexota bacterium]|jgi:hypothetical protein
MIFLNAIAFGLAVAFMLIGLIGIVIPILPGILLIWLTILAYAVVDGFQAIDWISFIFITIIGLITGTADIWLALLGAKTGGAAKRAMFFGFIGGVLGFFLLGAVLPVVGNLFGGIIGYAVGVLLGQYQKFQDWNVAFKASVGGVVGWGVASVVQIAGGLLMILIFIWQVLSY